MPQQLGRYKIVRELGKGAMGVVYEGLDPNIGRRVAIKTARRDVINASSNASEMMERFLREARAAGALNHPNIITIYDADEENGIAYIAMEFLDGGDLRDVIEKHKQLDPEDIVELGAAVCEALACAHDHGVVHRDIKPANVMMPANAPAKVADFGIAHMSDSTLTQEGALIGTPFYMSPEQFMGKKVDGRSDLFSVAVMLYELATGEKPFTGEALSTVMHHVIRTDPVPPHELNFNITEPLSLVILKSMSKRPADRYPNGRAMAVALRESLKPNPNPELLLLSPRGDDAGTVVSGAAPAADATVITAPRQTLPAAPDAGDAPTVTTAGRLADTAPTGGAVDSGTIAGGPPPGVQSPAAPVTIAVAPSPIAGWTKPPKLYFGIGAAVVALLIVIGLITALGGGGEEQGVIPPQANGSETATVPDVTTPSQGSVTVFVSVHKTSDFDLYSEYSNLPRGEAGAFVKNLYQKQDERIEETRAHIKLWDKEMETLLGEGDVNEAGGRVICNKSVPELKVTGTIQGSDETFDFPWSIVVEPGATTTPIQDILVYAS